MEILFVIVVAYLLVYRTTVGTWCALTGKQTPWEKARETRAAKAAAGRPTNPLRTARGFLGRLYGDLWEDLNAWLDEARARRINGERRRTVREWCSDLFDTARGLFHRDQPVQTQPEQPEMVGQTVRPPEEVPDLETVTTDDADPEQPPHAPVQALTATDHSPDNPDSFHDLVDQPREPLPGRPPSDPASTESLELSDQHVPDSSLDSGPGPVTQLQAGTEQAEHEQPSQQTSEPSPPDTSRLNPESAPAKAPHLSLVPPAPQTPATALAAQHPIEQGAPDMVDLDGNRQDLGGNGNNGNAPTANEIATVETLKNFGTDTAEFARGELAQKFESAREAASRAGFLNDPDMVEAFGRYTQCKDALASAGENLFDVASGHNAAEEAVSGLGDRAANSTDAYKRR